jgi:alanine racemase
LPCLIYYVPVWKCKEITTNDKVGYDNEGIVSKNGYLLTLPIGYSTSFSKINNLSLIHNNSTISLIGKHCMDMSMFYSEDKIKEGTYIDVLSQENIFNLINKYNTSIYYLLSSLSMSIQRKYKE